MAEVVPSCCCPARTSFAGLFLNYRCWKSLAQQGLGILPASNGRVEGKVRESKGVCVGRTPRVEIG